MLNRSTRRHFQGQLGVALAGGSWILPMACQAPAEESASGSGESGERPACDFQSSFMTWDYPPPEYTEKHDIPLGNMARIQLDAMIDVIEYPIKTMNFMPKDNSYQIDTGPLLVPDFDLDEAAVIDRLEMAHVAFNHKAPDLAEFILRQPTAVTDEEGRELCRILHYSKVRVDSARNTLLAGIA